MLPPNRLQSALLRACLGEHDAEAMTGDLSAEAMRLVESGRRPWQAAAWRWGQVLMACVHATVPRSRRHWRFPLGHDIRVASRSLLRRPASTLAMILTLALGIGANAAGFTVLDALLFRPLPYPDTDRLVVLRETQPSKPESPGGVSYLNFADWRAGTHSFESMALVLPDEASMSTGTGVIAASGLHVSPGFFATLGIRAARGATFDGLGDEALLDNGARPVMLSDSGWRRHFGAAPDAVGRMLELDGHLAQIVGVTPPGVYPIIEEPIDYWATTLSHGRASDATSTNGSRNFRQYPGVLARLRPGVTMDAALEDVKRIQGQLAERHPRAFTDRDVRIDPLRDLLVRPAARVAWLAYGLVTVVWLIACVNVANMSLARAAARHREVAVRRALGASKLAIARQFVIESLGIALVSAVAGLALAGWLLAGLVSFLPADLPAVSALAPDARVFMQALGVAILSALLCGGVPGWFAALSSHSGRPLNDGRQAARVPAPLRDGLIAIQVALALVLLAAGGLMMNSLLRLERAAPGFDLSDVWTTRLTLSAAGSQGGNLMAELQEVKQAVSRINGVRQVAFSQSVPFTGMENSTQVRVAGAPVTDTPPSAQLRFVSPEYFELMAIPVKQGRGLTDRDAPSSTPVAVVNDAFVRQHLSNQAPLGTSLALGWGGEAPKTVVGVVGDIRHRGPGDAARPEVYVPQAQFPNATLNVLVRTAPGVVPSAQDLHRAIQSVRPEMPRHAVRSLADFRSDTLSTPRFSALVLAGFAGVALFLAALGLYGVTTYLTEHRTKEIGVRMALGAGAGGVLWLIVRQALRPVGLGLVLGGAGAALTTGLLRSWLYDVAPSDPLTLSVVALMLVLVTGVACLIPARRAARIDPVTALRAD